MKTLHNSDASGAKKNVGDIKFFGDGDTFALICKASSEKEGWMKSTKAMEIPGVGCVVQVTTQQRNAEGAPDSVAEAACFVPGVRIEEMREKLNDDKDDGSTELLGRKLVAINRKREPLKQPLKEES